MARRNRTDSAAGQLLAMRNAQARLPDPPPETPLPDSALIFWDAIIRAKSRDEWDENQLQVAAQLARVRDQILSEENLLSREGTVLADDRGKPMVNPRCGVIEQMNRRQLSLMRALQITATALHGQAADNVKRRLAERRARDIIDDDLLA